METETEREDEDVPSREYKVNGKAMPSLIETLGLCYLGVVLLRLPVGMGEIHRYVGVAASFAKTLAYVDGFQLGCSRRHTLHQGGAVCAYSDEAKTTGRVSQSTRYYGVPDPVTTGSPSNNINSRPWSQTTFAKQFTTSHSSTRTTSNSSSHRSMPLYYSMSTSET